MQDKFYVILAYAGIGIAIALWPSFLAANAGMAAGAPLSMSQRPAIATRWAVAVLLIAAFGVIEITGESVLSPLILAFSLVVLATSVSDGRFDTVGALTGFIALCVSATLLWWERQNGPLAISEYVLVVFSLVMVLLIRLFAAQTPARAGGFPITWIIVYACVAALLTFSTGIFDDDYAFRMLWHHWGAYVGPAELLLSGAAIFHDFPAQYGLGPTTLIAGFCGTDCWHAMYFVAGFATLAYSVLLAVLAMALSRNTWPVRLAVLALCLATSFMWAGFPPDISSPMTTPSVSGMRFLPATLLLTYLFFAEDIERSRRKLLVAHALWALGVLWSPESAFYVTFLWWPYCLFVRRVQGDAFSRVKGLVKAGMGLLAVALGVVGVFYGVFRLVYKEGPTFYGIFAYAIDPPGPVPIDWQGAVWFFLLASAAGLGTSLYSWRRSGDTHAFRRGFLLQLANYGAFSYFLGRSHDNNLLNIMPFVLLVLLQAISAAESRVLSRTGAVLAASLLGWLPLFGWQAWHENVVDGRVLAFDSRIDARFTPTADIQRVIGYISQHYGEPATVLDDSFDLMRSSPALAWSALHGPENYAFMPSGRRREFLRSTAASLKRTGWVIVARNFPADDWLADYDFAYRRAARLEFGRYYAIRYSPKIH